MTSLVVALSGAMIEWQPSPGILMLAAISALSKELDAGFRSLRCSRNAEIRMTSSPRCTALVAGGSSSVGAVQADSFARPGVDPHHPRPPESSEVTRLSRVGRSLVVSARRPPRILLVDAALAMYELHIALLRSIPAFVEKLVSCADMYLHEEDAYALVILALRPQARETAEVAHFVRHRWSAARILLLESESAVIDDWLYDERVDPHPQPATVRDAAIRLMTEEQYWIPA